MSASDETIVASSPAAAVVEAPAAAPAAEPAAASAAVSESAPAAAPAAAEAAVEATPAPAAAAAAVVAPVEMMQALFLTKYASATEGIKSGVYTVGPQPKPTLGSPTDLLIAVHAASINPIDFKLARGDLKALATLAFPLKLGYDVSGTVAAIGAGVTKFMVGDAVFARVEQQHMGTFAEFALSSESVTVAKPKNLTHTQAACLPLAGQTALQAIRLSGIEAKPAPRTAFIPAALGGVGSLAIQLARNQFHIEKILTAVSTAKLEQTKQLLGGGAADDLEIVDYKAEKPGTKFAGRADFVFDTTGEASDYMPILKKAAAKESPESAFLVSIATVPSGDQAVAAFGPSVGWVVRQVLNFKNWNLKRQAASQHAKYSYLWLKEAAEDLTLLKDLAEAGQFRPIVGQTFPLAQAAQAVEAAASGKITGKVVIQVVPEEADAAAPAPAAADASASSSSSSA